MSQRLLAFYRKAYLRWSFEHFWTEWEIREIQASARRIAAELKELYD